jgi:hypothetical protein
MWSQRSVVDYSLARRALLRDLFSGRATTTDVCDAHPYLQRAARYYGEPTDTVCPVCRRERLTQVAYTYGDALREASGRAHTRGDLPSMAARYAEFRVYEVEVCAGCGWNHLTTSYLLGTGDAQPVARSESRQG